MNKKEHLYISDNSTIKWENEGKLYCLHIQDDTDPQNPREDTELLTTMACWHRRYRLGDEEANKSNLSPEEFWQRLVRQNVSADEVLKAIEEGKIPGIRIAESKENPELVDVYETTYLDTPLGRSPASEALEYEGIHKGAILDCIDTDLTIGHCMTLMHPHAEWLPLWLYDHSGLTMSCGARTGQYADRWDSMQTGWIFAMKDTIMANAVEILLDESGEPIKVEHKHEERASTWSVQTRPLTDETWRARAIEIMEVEVAEYDTYLRGEVYGYTVYEAEHTADDKHTDWEEQDSCWGFLGDDLYQNGMLDCVGYGLDEAIKKGEYKEGEAQQRTITVYEF